MLCILLMLFAIVSCGAQELLTSAEPEQYSINAVDLPKSSASNAGSRIIGGSPASIENYPFIVQVQYIGSLLCGGTFVTRRHVLSAAHCFINEYGIVPDPRYFTIRAGTAYLGAGGEVYNVSQIIVHESYNQTVHDNDIAVMVLSSEVSLNSSIDTAMLPLAGENLPDNTTVMVAGWGKTNVSATASSPVLNEVSVQTVNQDTCVVRYLYLQIISGYPFPVTNAMLCAGLLDVGGADACQGDSGGPLLYQGILVGITSWGYSCAEPLFPGVYTRVSMFTTWINNTVNKIDNNNSTVTPEVTPDGNSTVTPGGQGNSAAIVGITTLLIPLLYVMLSV